MIRQVQLQQFQAPVEGVDEAEPARQRVEEADAAAGDAAGPLPDLLVDVAGRHHGLGAAAEILLVQPPLDPALAPGQFSSYARFHSKSLRATSVGENSYFIQHRKCPGISSFLDIFIPRRRVTSLA
jgi:hypothetical protein